MLFRPMFFKKNIADYFLKNMGDLIDAGKVVVMQ